MRICLLTPDRESQGLNGPRRVAEEAGLGLASAGHQVHLIGHAGDAPGAPSERGIWRHEVPIVDRRISGLEDSPVGMDLLGAAVAKYREVIKIHRSEPVDVVVSAIWPGEGLVCLLDPRLATVTLLVTPVKLQLDRRWLSGEPFETMARVERAVIERTHYLHTTTGAIATDVEEAFGISLPASESAPLFTTDRATKPDFERYARPDEVEVLLVGRPEPRKGADVLVAAARRLGPESSAVYVIVGQGNWDAIRAEVQAEPGLSERCVFLGPVDEERLWRIYAGADIVCVPSRYESFGWAVIEAMMFGKPLVATNVGGIPATVEAGGNALICAPDDPDALASCLERLILDGELRNAFAHRSRELYVQRYSPGPGAKRVAALYASIAADHRRGIGMDPLNASTVNLTDSLATAIEEIEGLDFDRASQVASELLDAGRAAELRTPPLTKAWRRLRGLNGRTRRSG